MAQQITNKVLFKVVVDGNTLKKDLNSVTNATTNYTNKITGATNATQSISKSLVAMSVQARAAGIGLTMGLTAPIMALAAGAITAATDFEKAMASVKAITRATSEEMAQFEKIIRDTAKSTPFSATEIARAVEELSKAGLSTAQILNGALVDSLYLAAGGEIDIASAANIASRALNTFKKDSLTVAQAADIIVGGANASTTSVDELSQSLEQAAAVANGFDVSFKDTVLTLAVFAQNGMAGSDAGTSLKTMLMRLNPVSDKAADAMKELGLITAEGTNIFYDATGGLKSLTEIAGIMQDKFSGMSLEERQRAMQTIFGTDAIRAANIMYKEGIAGFENMAKAMEGISAKQVALEKWDNVNDKFKIFLNKLKDLAIEISERFIPIIKDVIDWAGELVDKFAALPPNLQNVALGFGAIAAAAGPLLLLLSVIGNTIGSIGNIGKLFATITGGGSLAPIIGGIIAAVVILGGVMIGLKKTWDNLWENSEQFRKSVVSIFDTLHDTWKLAKDNFAPIWETIKETVGGIWEYIKKLQVKIANEIMPILKDLIEKAVRVFQDFWSQADNREAVKKLIEFLGKFVEFLVLIMYYVDLNILKGLLEGFEKFIEFAGKISELTGKFVDFSNSSKDFANDVKTNIEDKLDAIKEKVQPVIDAVDKFKNAVSDFKKEYERITGEMARVTSILVQAILFPFQIMYAVLVLGILATVQQIKNTLSEGWEWLKTKAKEFWDFISPLIEPVTSRYKDDWDSMVTYLVQKLGELRGQIQYFANQVGDAFGGIGNRIRAGIFNGLDGIKDMLNDYVLAPMSRMANNINRMNIPGMYIPPIALLANGGTLRDGTAIVGENAPEILTMRNGAAQVTPLVGSQRARNLSDLNGGTSGNTFNFNISGFYGDENFLVTKITDSIDRVMGGRLNVVG